MMDHAGIVVNFDAYSPLPCWQPAFQAKLVLLGRNPIDSFAHGLGSRLIVSRPPPDSEFLNLPVSATDLLRRPSAVRGFRAD